MAPRPVTPLAILVEQLDHLSHELDGVHGLDPAFAARFRAACALAEGLDPYVARCTTPESPALAALARRTQLTDWEQHSPDAEATGGVLLEQEMLSGHVEGQLLKFLVHATRATQVLEIGMFTGYASLAMAEALPEHGRVVACELDERAADLARVAFDAAPDGRKVSIRMGPALATLTQLAAAGEAFDLVFLDADKSGYAAYLDVLLATGLLAPHGIVCVDNTLMQGQPYLTTRATVNGSAIAAFNAMVAGDPRVEQVLIPLRDGITLIRRV